MSGTLFVVATPIGNLDDLTPRARETLRTVSIVAAEDTRHTGRLLMHIGAKPRQIALHEHNEANVVERLIAALKDGDNVALVSDAGTPLVSDPGFRLVRTAQEKGLTVSPVPGASAVIAALSAAGLPTDRFCFEGFPPAKAAARRRWLGERESEPRTLVVYESVHRVVECMDDMVAVFGADRMAFIGRELTKMHEQCVRGSLGELAEMLAVATIPTKGEFVIVISGSQGKSDQTFDTDTLLRELGEVLPAKQAAGITARVSGQKKNVLYQRLLELRSEN